MMLYRPPDPDGRAWREVGDTCWGKLAGVIYAAHGGQPPGDPPAEGPDP